MNLYISIEVKSRELEGRLLLALAAAERGHCVVLGRKKEIHDLTLLGKLSRGVVHLKDVQPVMRDKIGRMKLQGYLVTSQDEEPGVINGEGDDFEYVRYSRETVALADRIYCWGAFDCRKVSAAYPEHAGKIIATGSPRTDFWRPEFAGVYLRNGENPSPRGRKYILVTSSFLWAHHIDPVDELLRTAKKKGVVRNAQDEQSYLAEIEHQRSVAQAFMAALRRLSPQVPDVDIIVRPHPMEKMQVWEDAVGDLPNVLVLRDGSVGRWIRGAEVVVHNCCTTGLEAAASGKTVFAYRPIRSQFDNDVPNQVSREFTIEDDLIQALVAHVDGPAADDKAGLDDDAEKPGRILQDRLANLEGPLAADRIVDDMESLATRHELTTASVEEIVASARSRPWSSAGRRLYRGIRALFGQTTADAKFEPLGEAEMENLKTRFGDALQRFDNVEVRRVGDFVYCLYPAHSRY